MIAWVAARNDARRLRHRRRVFQFPSETLGLRAGPGRGPDRRRPDDQRPDHASGTSPAARSIRGNLIVVPVGDSLIYLQPVYLQSTSAKFPAFERIVVASPTERRLGRRRSSEALNLLLRRGGRRRGPARRRRRPRPDPGADADARTRRRPPGARAARRATCQALVAYANQHFELAQAALRNGDFATYGARDRARPGRPSPSSRP